MKLRPPAMKKPLTISDTKSDPLLTPTIWTAIMPRSMYRHHSIPMRGSHRTEGSPDGSIRVKSISTLRWKRTILQTRVMKTRLMSSPRSLHQTICLSHVRISTMLPKTIRMKWDTTTVIPTLPLSPETYSSTTVSVPIYRWSSLRSEVKIREVRGVSVLLWLDPSESWSSNRTEAIAISWTTTTPPYSAFLPGRP